MWYFYTSVIVHVISNITLHFTHIRSIEMCRVFVLCSLHSSVRCGLWLNMCDIWSVVYTRQTYYTSFHMPLIAQYSFNRFEMHLAQADSTLVVLVVVKFMILVYKVICLMSGLYCMPGRDYTCCFLYPLLRLTTSLITCWGITGCDRSISHLFCWALAGFVTSHFFTYTNNLVYSICLYLWIVFKWPVSWGSPLSSGIFVSKVLGLYG